MQPCRGVLSSFYRDLVAAGSLCFDVGANVGDKTAALLDAGAASVVAVEPQHHCADALRARFAADQVVVVECGLGASAGWAELYPSAFDTLSSFSSDWIGAATGAGRFPGNRWDAPIPVTMNTLDGLIDEFGLPRFCKIDVEGYEEQVLQGLTHTGLEILSFEFTPEALTTAERSVDLLVALGFRRFNFVHAEETRFRLEWGNPEQVKQYLEAAPNDGVFFGDVYALSRRD